MSEIIYRKELKDISWKVDESTYRADPAFSYSILARFHREGFNGLNTLFDRVESLSLTFGSIVDTLITGTEEEFNNLFFVAEFPKLSDALLSITKCLYDNYHETYNTIDKIPDDVLIETIKDISWNNHWQDKTRVKKIKEDCDQYYNLLHLSENKTIISNYDYMSALKCVDALKTSIPTRFYFEKDDMFDDNIRRFYQLKFRTTFNNIDYRCMADLIVVIHNKKMVIPVDLKTSSKPEWDFYKSFIDWSYSIQARLYWRIIRANMDKDDFYRDYILADYKFIVVNRNTLTPLVWTFDNTKTEGPIEMQDKNHTIFPDPLQLGQDLNYYLTHKANVPIEINECMPNHLEEFINKH